MNLREQWAGSLDCGLQWSPVVERAIDRIAAGGFCKPVGLALFHARYGNDPTSYREALAQLERILARRGVDAEVREAVAQQVMREYIWEFCPRCLGSGEVTSGKLRVVCNSCGGTTVHRWSDVERALQMKLEIDQVRTLQDTMRWMLDYVQKEDRQVNAMLVMQLREVA